MIANYAVASPTDNNGPGLPRVVSLDVSSLGTFTNGSLLKIDSTTDVNKRPNCRNHCADVAGPDHVEWLRRGVCEVAIADLAAAGRETQ